MVCSCGLGPHPGYSCSNSPQLFAHKQKLKLERDLQDIAKISQRREKSHKQDSSNNSWQNTNNSSSSATDTVDVEAIGKVITGVAIGAALLVKGVHSGFKYCLDRADGGEGKDNRNSFAAGVMTAAFLSASATIIYGVSTWEERQIAKYPAIGLVINRDMETFFAFHTNGKRAQGMAMDLCAKSNFPMCREIYYTDPGKKTCLEYVIDPKVSIDNWNVLDKPPEKKPYLQKQVYACNYK